MDSLASFSSHWSIQGKSICHVVMSYAVQSLKEYSMYISWIGIFDTILLLSFLIVKWDKIFSFYISVEGANMDLAKTERKKTWKN